MQNDKATVERSQDKANLLRQFVGGAGFGMIFLGLSTLAVLLPPGPNGYARVGPLAGWALGTFLVYRLRCRKAPGDAVVVAPVESVIVFLLGMAVGVFVATKPWDQSTWTPPHTREGALAAAQLVRHQIVWDSATFGTIGVALLFTTHLLARGARRASQA